MPDRASRTHHDQMNIALIGTGRMGAAIAELAHPEHTVVARFNRLNPLTRASFDGMRLPDVAIDFSSADAVAANVDICSQLGIPVVVGTTGWQGNRASVEQSVREANGTLLHASNFSIGIAVVRQMLRTALPSLNRIDDVSVRIHDVHHANKQDAPSGTALALGNMILGGLDNISRIDPVDDPDSSAHDAIAITSDRVGDVFGTHSVEFSTPLDSITIIHDARSRTGFAAGAIRAAEWLVGRRGVYTFDDVFGGLSQPVVFRSAVRSDPPAVPYMHAFGV